MLLSKYVIKMKQLHLYHMIFGKEEINLYTQAKKGDDVYNENSIDLNKIG